MDKKLREVIEETLEKGKLYYHCCYCSGIYSYKEKQNYLFKGTQTLDEEFKDYDISTGPCDPCMDDWRKNREKQQVEKFLQAQDDLCDLVKYHHLAHKIKNVDDADRVTERREEIMKKYKITEESFFFCYFKFVDNIWKQ